MIVKYTLLSLTLGHPPPCPTRLRVTQASWTVILAPRHICCNLMLASLSIHTHPHTSNQSRARQAHHTRWCCQSKAASPTRTRPHSPSTAGPPRQKPALARVHACCQIPLAHSSTRLSSLTDAACSLIHTPPQAGRAAAQPRATVPSHYSFCVAAAAVAVQGEQSAVKGPPRRPQSSCTTSETTTRVSGVMNPQTLTGAAMPTPGMHGAVSSHSCRTCCTLSASFWNKICLHSHPQRSPPRRLDTAESNRRGTGIQHRNSFTSTATARTVEREL